MATHSSIIAWSVPWTEEPGRLQTMGSQRVGCDLAPKQELTCISVEKEKCATSIKTVKTSNIWSFNDESCFNIFTEMLQFYLTKPLSHY